MRILQLCCFTNLWSDKHEVVSIDKKNGLDVFNIDLTYTKGFDLIVSAPPCDQFTKANCVNWETSPRDYIKIAEKCFQIQVDSGLSWLLENPPGRIEKLIPGLTKYRLLTYQDDEYNKEYVIYGNILLLDMYKKRYGKKGLRSTKKLREEWTTGLVRMFENNI